MPANTGYAVGIQLLGGQRSVSAIEFYATVSATQPAAPSGKSIQSARQKTPANRHMKAPSGFEPLFPTARLIQGETGRSEGGPT